MHISSYLPEAGFFRTIPDTGGKEDRLINDIRPTGSVHYDTPRISISRYEFSIFRI